VMIGFLGLLLSVFLLVLGLDMKLSLTKLSRDLYWCRTCKLVRVVCTSYDLKPWIS
jgi:hypothetical protein